MTEFIQQAMQQLGTSEDETKSAAGGLLGAIKGQVAGGDFAELLQKVPGADALVAETGEDEEAGGGGGLLGGLVGQAAGALGGDGGAAGIVGAVAKSGLSLDKAGPFVGLFLNFVKAKAGDGLVGKILTQIPELAGMAGSE